jgi:UDP-2,3-diacylglucosamine hydrolase
MWVFFSDVHLLDSNSEREKKILAFLDLVKDDLEGLGIIGDLFDFWFGYKTVIFNQFVPVIAKLKEISDKGVKILYIAGNHDFHFGPLFDTIVPIETHSQPYILELGNKKIFLHHGDGIDKKDIRYNIFKRIVRNPITLALSQWVHPNLGWNIAKALSKTSHNYFHKTEKRKRYLNACRDFAMKKFNEGNDIMVFGHLHYPFIKKFEIAGKEKLLINLGDWLFHDTFLRYDDRSGFTLMKFDYTKKTLQEFNSKIDSEDSG